MLNLWIQKRLSASVMEEENWNQAHVCLPPLQHFISGHPQIQTSISIWISQWGKCAIGRETIRPYMKTGTECRFHGFPSLRSYRWISPLPNQDFQELLIIAQRSHSLIPASSPQLLFSSVQSLFSPGSLATQGHQEYLGITAFLNSHLFCIVFPEG